MPHSPAEPQEQPAAVQPVAQAAGPDDLRSMMQRFPTGVAVVTTVDEHGLPRGMTCTSLTSVTLSPPTVLVCLNRGSGTSRAVHQHGAFAVNLLHGRARETARLFAGRHPDRFGALRWRRCRSLGVPVLDEHAVTTAVCSVQDSMPVGDHDVFFGRAHEIEEFEGVPLLHGMQEFQVWQRSADVPGAQS